MITLVRWFMVLVVGVAAMYAAAFTVVGLDWIYWQFDYPCPEELLVSGGCPNVSVDWYSTYTAVMECAGAGFAAIYVVVACTLMAPSHKKWVAILVYGVGALAAGFLGRSMALYLPMVIALVAGAGAAVLMNRRYAVAHAA